MLFRFVPYVGVPLAFLIPAVLAVAVDPGWSMLLWVVVLFAGVETVIGQMVEPFIYGRSMGLSAVAVVVVPMKAFPGEPGVTVQPGISVFWSPTRTARLASAWTTAAGGTAPVADEEWCFL